MSEHESGPDSVQALPVEDKKVEEQAASQVEEATQSPPAEMDPAGTEEKGSAGTDEAGVESEEKGEEKPGDNAAPVEEEKDVGEESKETVEEMKTNDEESKDTVNQKDLPTVNIPLNDSPAPNEEGETDSTPSTPNSTNRRSRRTPSIALSISSTSSGHQTVSSIVFVKKALEAIGKSNDARKISSLETAVKKALSRLCVF
jgi:hypothetical protein